MSFKAIFGTVLAKLRNKRWSPDDTNKLAEELYDAFTSQGPIVLTGPVIVHNPTAGPAISIINTAETENPSGIEIADTAGRRVKLGIGLGSRGIIAGNFVFDESTRTDPDAVIEAYGKSGQGGQVVFNTESTSPISGTAYSNNKQTEVASGFSYENSGSGIPDVHVPDVEDANWIPLTGVGEMLGEIEDSSIDTASASGSHPPNSALVSVLNEQFLWWPKDLNGWAINRCTVLEINPDTLTCQRDLVGDTIEVAKPYSLQRTPFDNKTINTVLYTYTGNQTRIASNASASENQEISPSYDGTSGYSPGNIVYARWVSNGTDIDDVNYIDINSDARAWISSG